MSETPDAPQAYEVVINGEEQYSVWFAGEDPPLGWTKVGFSGAKDACLAFIEKVWTDMRPLSVRSPSSDGAT